MTRLINDKLAWACTAALAAFTLQSSAAWADENVAGGPKEDVSITEANAKSAQVQQERTLTDPKKLSDKTRAILGLEGRPAGEAAGTAGHPFTTKRASADNSVEPIVKFPWRATGKLFMKFGDSTFVCTASVIDKSLLVSAAHCVHNFGEKRDGFADAVTFEPARHEGDKPFGTWTGKQWWIPKVYFDGTDKCSDEAPGVVCENDVAVIVVGEKGGKSIADETGRYGFQDDSSKVNGFGYFEFLGEKAAQITQLGYPSANYDGDKMIRTDALGYQDKPNNLVIGSNQTGGSSGGPWLVNFGTDTSSFGGTEPFDNESNQVIGTTSWGFISDQVKAQGASRFAKNAAYTTKSNIQSLVDSACGANPGACGN